MRHHAIWQCSNAITRGVAPIVTVLSSAIAVKVRVKSQRKKSSQVEGQAVLKTEHLVKNQLDKLIPQCGMQILWCSINHHMC